MTSINFLHLTDLHLGARGQDARERGIRTKFLEDLEAIHGSAGPWDLVFFTGDLTNTGAEREFGLVDRFLADLDERLRRLQKTSPIILAVPGNHDLVRPPSSSPAVRELMHWDQGEKWWDQFWTDPSSEHRQVVDAAFANYSRWWEDRCAHVPGVRWGLLPGDFSFTLEKDGARLGIVGLNAAYCHLGDAHPGSMATAAQQLEGACGGDRGAFEWAKEHHGCVVLTHHPDAWLSPRSKAEFEAHVADPRYFLAHLCGHCHVPRGKRTNLAFAENDRFQLLGMSLFGLEHFKTDEGLEELRLHGYCAGRIELENGRATVLLWPRAATQPDGAWTFHVDPDHFVLDPQTERTTKRWSWERKWLVTPPSGPPAPPPPRPNDLVLTATVHADRTVELRIAGRRVVRGTVQLGPATLHTIRLLRQWLMARAWADDTADDRPGVAPWRWLEAMGRLQYEGLFNGAVAAELERYITSGVAHSSQRNVRLNLCFSGCDDLAGVNWEYMYYTPRPDPSGHEGLGFYLSSRADLGLSRLSEGQTADDPGQLRTGKLKLELVLLRDCVAPDPDGEVSEALSEKAIASWMKEVEARTTTSSKQFDAAESVADIVHVVARAEPDPSGAHQIAWPLERRRSCDDVAQQLGKREPRPRLVLLQLQADGAGAEQCISSIAQRLISVGVRFVVALQQGVTDALALKFAKAFYSKLDQEKNVSAAVQKGREAIEHSGVAGKFLFGRAVLYLCSDLPLALKSSEETTDPATRYVGGSQASSGPSETPEPRHPLPQPEQRTVSVQAAGGAPPASSPGGAIAAVGLRELVQTPARD